MSTVKVLLDPLILGFFLIIVLFVQESQCSCQGQRTCDDCISSTYSCVWCSQKNFTSARCGTKATLQKLGCEYSNIIDPIYSMRKIEDAEVDDGKGEADAAVQIQPQLIKIETRPRHETQFMMKFRAANNYPVDLYFLYDVSVSMKDAIKNLGKLADDIGQAIGDISSNFRMGYGVFQDKVILPFTDTSPKRLINPCFMMQQPQPPCDPPFEYKHVLDMTKDIERFKNAINNTRLTANNDHPEGSLDAIMQAIMCKSAIGWRGGRKMLIFSSNARFHSAGAGRLAGIITPNDGQCHLDDGGHYAMQLMQDYPSVSQLTHAVKTEEIHVIFIVENKFLDLFEELSKRVPDSTVEKLGNQNDPKNQNIKNVIERKYKEIVSGVEIIHNNVSGVDVRIKATSDVCEQRGTNKCKGLQIGKEIEFSVEVSVTDCPKRKEDRKKRLILQPKSLSSDQLVIEIDVMCDCACTTDESTWDTSPDVCTNGNGTLKCGICSCNEGRFGSKCECDGSEADNLDNDCINPEDKVLGLPCSGRGSCKCGQCSCLGEYTGQFCECNDKACKSFQGEICGGARGYCSCGQCVCTEAYTGPACECATSNSTCFKDGILCSDSGSCECGVCKCDTGYTGEFCSECFLCGDSACDIQDYRICAECALGERKGIDCMVDCPPVELVDRLSDNESSVCSLRQTDDCLLTYTPSVHEGNVTLYVQRTKTCAEPVDIIPIVAGVVAGIVVIGLLLLLLWKILTTIFDRLEYSKFQEDLKNCKWAKQENPVYREATTTYKNPLVYTGEAQD